MAKWSTVFNPVHGDASVISIGIKGNGANSITVDANDATTAWTLKLPPADGTPNQVLATSGAGSTAWVTQSGGGSSSAGGSGTVQYSDGAGAFLSNSTMSFNATQKSLSLQSGAGGAVGSTFVGYLAGFNSTCSEFTSLFGYCAGAALTTGSGNTLIGSNAGLSLTTSSGNTIVGNGAAPSMTGASVVTAFGVGTLLNATGTGNTAVGANAGIGITTGGFNTFIGSGSCAGNNISSATAIGSNSCVNISNAIVLGNPGSASIKVGVGTASPAFRLDVVAFSTIEGNYVTNFENTHGSYTGAILRLANRHQTVAPQLDFINAYGAEKRFSISAIPTTNYTLLMPPAPPVSSGQVLSATTGGVASWITPVTSTPPVQKTANYLAVSGDRILADTLTIGAFTITLPAAPAVGDIITVIDGANNFATSNLTIARNGSNIQGAAADFTMGVNNTWAEFIYNGASRGWEIRV